MGIPPSKFTESGFPIFIGERQQEVNRCLEEWALSNPNMVCCYVDMGKEVPYSNDKGGNWEPDGKHCVCSL